MKNILNKKAVAEIEKLGWGVNHNTPDFISITNYSPAGGEMTLECSSLDDLINCCENYDCDDEFDLFYEAGKNGLGGVPSTPSALLKDCDAKGDMYEALQTILQKYQK